MTTDKITKLALIVAVGGILLGAGLSTAQGGPPTSRRANVASPAEISEEAKEALLEALVGPEGEYAAYAVYDAVIQEYGEIEPYLSIRQAEANHIAALQKQLDLYGVDYPKENPYLGKVEVPDDLEAFAKAGVAAEIANVEMYDELLDKVSDYPNIARVFENLRAASLDQHLPAFEKAAANGGSLPSAQMRGSADRRAGSGWRGQTKAAGGKHGSHGRMTGPNANSGGEKVSGHGFGRGRGRQTERNSAR